VAFVGQLVKAHIQLQAIEGNGWDTKKNKTSKRLIL